MKLRGSDTPRAKSLHETLIPAIVGLVGVLVGGLITTGANYLLAVRSEQVERAKAERARNAEVRTAARLIAEELAPFAAAAQMLLEKKNPAEPDVRSLAGAWSQNKAVLAREIDNESFNAVSHAINRASSFKWLCCLWPSESDIQSLHADIRRGVEALGPYSR